jgi:hypothetical protein
MLAISQDIICRSRILVRQLAAPFGDFHDLFDRVQDLPSAPEPLETFFKRMDNSLSKVFTARGGNLPRQLFGPRISNAERHTNSLY